MKLKLVLLKGEKLLYCPNGSILRANESVLARLLIEFNHPNKFKGVDGCWNSTNSDMKDTEGTMLAVVDDQLNLIVYSTKAFSAVKESVEYISASEYAEKHGKSHSLIRRLCEEGRIIGVKQNRSGWLIPKDAPYPNRKKREAKKQ